MKKIVLAGLLIGTLAGCGQQTSSHPQQSNTTKTQPQQNTDQQDFSDYWNQLKDPFSNLEADVGVVSNLSLEGANNPSELTTQEYRDRVQQACDKMDRDAQDIENIPTPNNPKVAAISNEILQGVEQVKYVADNLPIGVDTLNTTIINNCTQAFSTGSDDFRKATTMVNDFKNGSN